MAPSVGTRPSATCWRSHPALIELKPAIPSKGWRSAGASSRAGEAAVAVTSTGGTATFARTSMATTFAGTAATSRASTGAVITGERRITSSAPTATRGSSRTVAA